MPQVLQNIIVLYVNPLIYVLFGVTLIYFLWGVLQYVRNAGDPDARTTGAKHVLWSFVGIAIMFGVFTIIRMVMNTINVPSEQRPTSIQQLR